MGEPEKGADAEGLIEAMAEYGYSEWRVGVAVGCHGKEEDWPQWHELNERRQAAEIHRARITLQAHNLITTAALPTAGQQVRDADGWRPVVGYEARYEVSSFGAVRETGGLLVGQFAHQHGYRRVKLSGPRKEFRVHRLVAEAFLPNPSHLPAVNHINHDRADNRVQNLEWCTQQENLAHARRAGRMPDNYWKGKRAPSAALSDETAEQIRSAYANGEGSFERLARRFGTSKRTVGRIIARESYV